MSNSLITGQVIGGMIAAQFIPDDVVEEHGLHVQSRDSWDGDMRHVLVKCGEYELEVRIPFEYLTLTTDRLWPAIEAAVQPQVFAIWAKEL